MPTKTADEQHAADEIDVKKLALMLLILCILLLPLMLLVNSNVDAMTEDVLRSYGNVPSPSTTSNGSSPPRNAAAKEKRKQSTSGIIDPTKFKSSWDMIMHFSKDYDSSVRTCITILCQYIIL